MRPVAGNLGRVANQHSADKQPVNYWLKRDLVARMKDAAGRNGDPNVAALVVRALTVEVERIEREASIGAGVDSN